MYIGLSFCSYEFNLKPWYICGNKRLIINWLGFEFEVYLKKGYIRP